MKNDKSQFVVLTSDFYFSLVISHWSFVILSKLSLRSRRLCGEDVWLRPWRTVSIRRIRENPCTKGRSETTSPYLWKRVLSAGSLLLLTACAGSRTGRQEAS